MLRLTQLLCLTLMLLLCQLMVQAVTTPSSKVALVQPTQVTSTTTTTTVKPKTKQLPAVAAAPAPWKQDAKCLQPLETGPCRMSLDRYYYNKEKKICETFKYGGCRGNDNRWGFKQTCEEACVGKKR